MAGPTPHTRGVGCDGPENVVNGGTNPAYAGKTWWCSCHSAASSGSTPRVRGIPLHRARQQARVRVNPAGAGNTLTDH